MTTVTESWTRHRAAVAAHARHHGADHPATEQARRALALARTEHRIRQAIDQAPPLDADTLARIRSLIPAVPTGGGGDGAA